MLDLIRTEWRLILFGFLMTFWSSPGQTFFISLFSGQLRADLGLSHGEFGNIYSLGTLLSAVVVIWTGTLLDRMDLRWFAQSLTLGLCIACLALAFAAGPLSLFLAIFLLRQFGQGLMIMCASTTMVRYFGDRKGSANALSGMGYRFGESVLPALVIALLLMMSWRDILLATAVLTVFVLSPACLFLLSGHGQRHELYHRSLALEENHAPLARQWQRKDVLRDLRFYLLMPAASCGAFLFTGFIFHQVYLVEYKGWSLQHWGYWFIAYGIVSTLAALAAGRIVDRYGASRLMAYIPLPLAAALLLLSSTSASWSGAAFLCLMSLSTGMTATASGPLIAELYGTLHLGAIKSAVAAIMVMASALSPALLGWCLDAGVSIDTLALFGSVYALIAAAMAYLALAKSRQELA